ncbi:MAG: iron-containing alcohol dehydrogenase [Bacteroidetes bacterium]|nr:iron-containing alcohol dehydrogenase [Bacteroidota bacterium]
MILPTTIYSPLAGMSLAAIPQLIQGSGSLKKLTEWLSGRRFTSLILCTGGKSFDNSLFKEELFKLFSVQGIDYKRFIVSGEPSPELIDSITNSAASEPYDCVVGIGGGSVMDAAKAVAAMIPVVRKNGAQKSVSVYDYLEGVGTKKPEADRLGLVTIPTTSGTGSEATKNAVISRIGVNGFKKSLRHDNYVPDLAILDANLIRTCPQDITASSGLDAVTQLLESYVSTLSNPFTDALAEDGLIRAGKSLMAVYDDGLNIQARGEMAYAAYLSGITLANANLGVVHGAAGLLGGIRPVPHGIACGTLLAEATKTITDKLVRDFDENNPALLKYSKAGYLLNFDKKYKNVKDGVTLLLDTLFTWQEVLKIPCLRKFGFTKEELLILAEKTDLKKTPVNLSVNEIRQIFTARL